MIQNRNNNYPPRTGGNNQERVEVIIPSFKKEWITTGANKEMIAFCEKMGEGLKSKNISSSQLRNIYGEIIRIKQKGFTSELASFYLLKPKIAYNAARLSNKFEKEFFKDKFITIFFNPALDAIDEKDENTFDNFQKMFEAILAYHKFYGAK
jgi:CRISPR-associated protein Csm2